MGRTIWEWYRSLAARWRGARREGLKNDPRQFEPGARTRGSSDLRERLAKDQPPLRPATTGKIAVKVINHYGDELEEGPALHPQCGGGLRHHSIRGGQLLDTGRAHDTEV